MSTASNSISGRSRIVFHLDWVAVLISKKGDWRARVPAGRLRLAGGSQGREPSSQPRMTTDRIGVREIRIGSCIYPCTSVVAFSVVLIAPAQALGHDGQQDDRALDRLLPVRL